MVSLFPSLAAWFVLKLLSTGNPFGPLRWILHMTRGSNERRTATHEPCARHFVEFRTAGSTMRNGGLAYVRKSPREKKVRDSRKAAGV